MNTRESTTAESLASNNSSESMVPEPFVLPVVDEKVSGFVGKWFNKGKNFLKQKGIALVNSLKRAPAVIANTATSSMDRVFDWASGKFAASVIRKGRASVEKADVSALVKATSAVVKKVAKGVTEGVEEAVKEVTAQAHLSANEMSAKLQATVNESVKDFQKTRTSTLDAVLKTVEQGLVSILMLPFKWCLSLLNTINHFFDLDSGKNSSNSGQSVLKTEPANQVMTGNTNETTNWKEQNRAEANLSTVNGTLFSTPASMEPSAPEVNSEKTNTPNLL